MVYFFFLAYYCSLELWKEQFIEKCNNVKVAHSVLMVFDTPIVGLMISKIVLVLYISVLYEYIYFSMHVQVEYYEHLQCCSFN